MPDKLTAEQKAVKVLRSQGHAPILLTACSDEARADLAAMYDAKDLPQRFSAWMDAHLKATIDVANAEADKKKAVKPTPPKPTITKAVSTDDDGS